MHYHNNLKQTSLSYHPMKRSTMTNQKKEKKTYHGSITRIQWRGATLICCPVMRNRYMTHGYRLRIIIASLTINKSPHTYYYISTIGWIRICIFLLNIQSMSIQSLCLVTAKVLGIIATWWIQLICFLSNLRVHWKISVPHLERCQSNRSFILQDSWQLIHHTN